MDSNAPVSVFAAQGTPSTARAPIAPSGTVLIRAPLSSDDTGSNIDSDGGGAASETDSFLSGDEEFETASERPFVPEADEEALEFGPGEVDLGGLEESRLRRKVSMPKAQPSGDDDVVGEEVVVEEGVVNEVDGDGFPIPANIPPLNEGIGSSSLVKDDEKVAAVSEIRVSGEVEGDYSQASSGVALDGNPNSGVHPKSGVLGSEGKKAEEELVLEDSTHDVFPGEVGEDILPRNSSVDRAAVSEPSDSAGLSGRGEAGQEGGEALAAKDEKATDVGPGVVTGVEENGVLNVEGEKSVNLGGRFMAVGEGNGVFNVQAEENGNSGGGSEEATNIAVVGRDLQYVHAQSDAEVVEGAVDKAVFDTLDKKQDELGTGFEEATSPNAESVADLKHAESKFDTWKVEQEVAPINSSSVETHEEAADLAVVGGDSQSVRAQSDDVDVERAVDNAAFDALDKKQDGLGTALWEATSLNAENVSELKPAESKFDTERVEQEAAPVSSSSVENPKEAANLAVLGGDSESVHAQSVAGPVEEAVDDAISDGLDKKQDGLGTGFEVATSHNAESEADLKPAESKLETVRVEQEVSPVTSSIVETPEEATNLAVMGGDSQSVHAHSDAGAVEGAVVNVVLNALDEEGDGLGTAFEEAAIPLAESVSDLKHVEPEFDSVGVEREQNGNADTSSPLEPGPGLKPKFGDTIVADDEENKELNEVEEGMVSEGPAEESTLGNSETTKQLIKDLEEGSSGTDSIFGSSRDYSHQVHGQIVSDSDEEVETDEEGDGKELFDSAALAELLKAATGASSDGNITITGQDAARIFSVDRPAGLGSSVPSLRPAPPRSTRSDLFASSDLTVVGEPEEMDEEEKKLAEKVEQIRVKFLRLVQRLGHSPEDTVAAQVLYRLGLAEGIRRGRQTGRAFNLEKARKKALQIEAEGKEELDFFCNILVLGKTGVGKSATINSIFGEEKTPTNAFNPATTSVKEILGTVDGVKVRVIDTPGLRPSVMDQSSNQRILSAIKKFTKKCPPDIVLYVDRLDTQTRDFNDLPLLRTIAGTLGSSIWFNAIVALTHAASAPPDGPNGSPLSYEVFIAQRSHVVQHSIRQAAGDMRLMNPVALVENHPSCRRNREGQKVLPNGLTWRPQLLLLCYSSKILSEANSLLKLQDPRPGKLFGFRVRSPPLPYLLSSLLQSRAHPKLPTDQGGDNGDSDIDLGDLSDSDQEEEEDEYDQLPPFKPLRKSQISKLTKEQRKAYFDEYDYRVKLLQKKQLKEEVRRLKEMKKRGRAPRDEFVYGDMAEDFDQDAAPAAVPVPLPDMVLPPSFDCDNPAYRYRFLEPTSQLLARPVLDTHGWDHDCGYDGVSLEENLAIAGQFPAGVSVQITKDKKEFNIHMDSSVAAKHGENASSLAGFDIQTVGKQLAYILRGETKFKNLKKNKTAAGVSVTFLGETIATGLKIEDQILIGKRASLAASAGGVRAQGDMAYGANLEVRIRERDFPIGQDLSTLGLSLMRWRNDLALGANLQSQFSVGRNSKMAVRVGLNNKLSGQVSIRTTSSEQLQIALLGIIPIAVSVFRSILPGESY